MLFWHLLLHENAHIRFSMLRFSFGRSFKIDEMKIYLRWRTGVAHFSALRHRRYKLTLEKIKNATPKSSAMCLPPAP